jgi:hypothetical protein
MAPHSLFVVPGIQAAIRIARIEIRLYPERAPMVRGCIFNLGLLRQAAPG